MVKGWGGEYKGSVIVMMDFNSKFLPLVVGHKI